MVSCLVCGGYWREDREGTKSAANGDMPTPCSGDTSQVHGDPREMGYDPDSINSHDCNCLHCA